MDVAIGKSSFLLSVEAAPWTGIGKLRTTMENKLVRALISLFSLIWIAGCGNLSESQRWAAGVAVGTAYLGRSPSNEIEQVYYVGVFDPQEQIPPSIYRLRVRGQASAMSQTRFASGWVRAEIADSLAGVSRLGKEPGQVEIKKAPEEAFGGLATGRRLMMFGPEGFREAPKDHRLVIVMGSSPEKYFSAIDEALGVVAAATQSRSPVQLDRTIFEELLQLSAERDGMTNLLRDLK